MTTRGERIAVATAAVVSWGYAVWSAAHPEGVPSPDVAHTHALALHAARAWSKGDLPWILDNLRVVVPNPQVVPVWMGLAMAVFGLTATVAAASLFPFHLLAAVGLWRGGEALGGRAGGAWAVVAGLGAAGPLAYGGALLLDFPLMACTAFAAGAALSGRWRGAAWGLAAAACVKLAALPVLAVLAVDVLARARLRVVPAALVVAALYLPNVPSLLEYASSSNAGGAVAAATSVGERLGFHLESLATLAGPAVLLGVVLGLLGRGDVATLRVLGWAAGVVAGLLPLAFFAQLRYTLPAVPLLAMAGAGAGRLGRAAIPALLAAAVGSALAYAGGVEGRLGRPEALSPAKGEPYDVDGALDRLLAHMPPGKQIARVALHVAGSERLHYGLFAVRSLERGLPFELVVVDDHRPLEDPTDLGLLVTVPGVPTAREGWRSQLPDPTEQWAWPDGYVVQLWDRGLPRESLLATPEEAEKRNHPVNQGLWVYTGGDEHGPLLAPASSVAVRHGKGGWEAVFVRDQALWWAPSEDGLRWDEPRPLSDEGGEIRAFDPSIVELPDGGIRLFAAELSGEDRAVDPATHPTRIVSWTGPDLAHLVRDEGARIEGIGLVDPVVVRGGDGWEMYLTAERRYVVRARSADGRTFVLDPTFRLDGTVPEPTSRGLLWQRQVMGWPVFEAGDVNGGVRAALELCGTGASIVEDRLYYTRAPEACPSEVADPTRRAALDALLGRR